MATPPFAFLDAARRRAGALLDAVGLGPEEAPFRTAATLPGARLRAYQPSGAGVEGPLLILPAPIKRPYLWDLLPAVSVVRGALAPGLRVHLLEWCDPSPAEDGFGLAEFADRIPLAALDAIAAETGREVVVVAGNSLGGTLAAIFAALHPERVAGLALIDAPLAFGPEGGPLAEAVARLPSARLICAVAGSPVAGSALGLLSAAAVPEVFLLQRWRDRAASVADPLAAAVHARIERWILDELAMPGRLFEEIVEGLYREDRFRQDRLPVGGRVAGLGGLRVPTLAVVNAVGGVVPPASVLAGLARAPGPPPCLLRYEGEPGPAIQHLGPLVGPAAHRRIWPAILDWIASR
jgi:polyhydroxyalkanoate synthase